MQVHRFLRDIRKTIQDFNRQQGGGQPPVLMFKTVHRNKKVPARSKQITGR